MKQSKHTAAPVDYPITPVPFTNVALTDRFWAPRIETNRTVTIPAVFRNCEEFGRLENIKKAAGLTAGSFDRGQPFDDTDVYKGIEGASYSLAAAADPQLDAYLDGIIELIAAAQEPDGYLYTARTIDPDHPHPMAGPERWSKLGASHELYNSGHLYDAASAHFRATGKRTLLDVALKNAALVRSVFNENGRHDVPGHQIIEMGLAKLYRITGDREYLETARFFLEGRGRYARRQMYHYANNPGYSQDHLPVLEQKEAVGHAVRAVYMYCGMADIAALLPDSAYAEAIRTIWRNMTDSKIYLTGGLGGRHAGEAFGDAYELPNAEAYNETCAAIGSVMWNHRLFLLSGRAEYLDVLEQTLYNGLLTGVSLSGNEFFYVNPLEADGTHPFNHGTAGRQPWFEVSCCPTSLCRFFPSLPGYLYAADRDEVYVNLFAESRTGFERDGVRFELEQRTGYPWDGTISITVRPERAARLRLKLRVPGWATGRLLGGPLYRYERPAFGVPEFRLNGEPIDDSIENGFAVIDRVWQPGDRIEMTLPMPVKKVLCDDRVPGNRGKAALMRGPVVYCVEGKDAEVPLDELRLGDEDTFEANLTAGPLGEIVSVRGPRFTAIPYYAWANRGPDAMKVWLRNG